MSKSVGHFLLLLLSSIFLLNSHGGVSSAPLPVCSESDCGNGVKIKYPFWNTDDATGEEYCGYPQFALSCSNKEPVLSIDNEEFLVKAIDYTNFTITLVDKDVAGNQCPRARHNITLGDYPLGFTDLDVNISFYFNCSSYPFISYATDGIVCLGFNSLQSYAVLVEDNTEDVVWMGKCQANVVVTVKKETNITGNGLISGFGAAMNRGFELNWTTAEKCGECERNKGFCGYNTTAAEYICYCQDGSIGNRCKGNGANVKLKVIIGVSASLGTLAITGILYFLWQRRKKNPYAPSSLNSQTNTSDFSSKFDSEKGGSMYGVRLFTYEQLEEATNNFDPKTELGEGGFGTVYYGKLQDGRSVAVKRLYENNYKRVEQFLNEVDLLTHLRHPNLVSLYGCTSRHSRELLLVYEYVPNGTVSDHLHGEKATPGSLPWHTRMKIAVETASALSYLHASDIIHRDVKTNNILLDHNFSVKVADFGLSRLFPLHATHVSTAPQGTPGYVDPEYHECYQLTDKSDVYSFGVVLIELISSLPAVDITRHRHEINLSNMAINKIQSNALDELVDHSLGFDSDCVVRRMMSAVAELAYQCLQCAKDLRPTMDQVLETLKLIKDKDYSLEKKREMDNTSDDLCLLKNGMPPLSPDTVMSQWKSTDTTPNTSG